MTSFVIDNNPGPGTHVFIIGVGKYPNLVNGTAPLSQAAYNMGQLTSPPISARRFLEFIGNELLNPEAPLKSIEVLISGTHANPYTAKNGQTAGIDAAIMNNAVQAAQSWSGRANTDPNNVAIFYFCGHGIGDGVDQQLLLEDYGAAPVALTGAIDFQRFRLAMGQCKALKQCYFVDACRTVNPMLLLNAGTRGNPLLPVDVSKIYSGSNPVIYSTRNGEPSFAPPDQASYFTDALMQGFTRFGAKPTKNRTWSISPHFLLLAMEVLLGRALKDKRQACTADSLGNGFSMHVLPNRPQVMVDITFNDPAASAVATLSWTQNGAKTLRPDGSHPWQTEVPQGPCQLDAQFPPGSGYQNATENEPSLMPPHREIELEVRP